MPDLKTILDVSGTLMNRHHVLQPAAALLGAFPLRLPECPAAA